MDPHLQQCPSENQPTPKEVNFLSRSYSTYKIKNELNLERVEEAIVSRDNRLVFVRTAERCVYQVLDVLTGGFVELQLDEGEIEQFNAFRLYPMKDPTLFTIIGRADLDISENYWSYLVAQFRFNINSKTLERTEDWSELVRSYKESGSYHLTKNQLFFIVGLETHKLVLKVYDIETRKFVVEEKDLQGNEDNQDRNWNKWDFKFRTYFERCIYGFQRFQHHMDRTSNLIELYRNFSHITKRSLESGKIQKEKLGNNLKCLQIDRSAIGQNSMFLVNGSWLDRFFHLHIQIEMSFSDYYPTNYFALIDLNHQKWRPILLTSPMELAQRQMLMITTVPLQQLIFLRSHSRVEKWLKKRKFRQRLDCFVDVYRVPLRCPDTLELMCALKFDALYGNDRKMVEEYGQFLIQPVEC